MQERFPILLVLLLSSVVWAQDNPTKPAPVTVYWDRLLEGAIPAAPPDPALTVPQEPRTNRGAADFLDHFFLESRTEYIRQEIAFSGRPTLTGVFDGPFTPFINPIGIPFHDAFQPNSDQIFQFLNWGTREWLSPRINTSFSFRYAQDLSHVTSASPALTLLNTLPSNRNLELLAGTVQIRGLASDGVFAGTSLQVGRQYIYGSELAAFDGASFQANRRRYSVSVFAGRRFARYSDPSQRAIGGMNLRLQLTPDTSVEYEGVAYVKGSQNIVVRHRFSPSWLFNTYVRIIGGSATDYSAQAFYAPSTGQTAVSASFLQKLSDRDFIYDYTVAAADRDPHNRLPRLYFGRVEPYSQGVLDVRHEITRRVRLGGSVWLRRLNDPAKQGPYDSSFDDYRINGQIFAPLGLQPFFEIRQRNTDRRSPAGATQFDDVSIAGETRMQEIQLELRRTFGEGRLALRGGGFYRRFNLQDRFFFINNAAVRGLTGGAQLKLDSRTRLYLDYSLDDDFLIFRPSIQHAQVFRLGMAWRY
jgi:hypothetical protein